MPQLVNLVVIVVLGVAPLFAALRNSKWPPTRVKTVMVAIPLLLFVVNAPIHEISHIVGTWLGGGTIGEVRLWQPFWKSNAPVAMVETSGLRTASAAFVSSVFPYAVDAVLLVGALLLLRGTPIRSPWGFAAFFLFLVLKPSFDIAANVAAWSIYGTGDFGQVAGILGRPAAAALQATLLAGAIGLTLTVARRYGREGAKTAPPSAAPTAKVRSRC
jgi:hypothetical protein